MGSSTKQNINKILAERNKQVKIEALEFEIKEKNRKIDTLRLKINNLEIENQKLKEENQKLKEM